jgi:hypothetical protein
MNYSDLTSLAKAKTIQIFLPDGNARGLRRAEVTNRNLYALHIPRKQIEQAQSRNELDRVGVYFLFGAPENAAKSHVYIGEAENCSARLKQHNVNKDFWTTAVAVTTKSNSFDKAQVKYLEWLIIDQAKKAGRYHIANGNQPNRPNISESRISDLADYAHTARTLLSTLGFPVLEQLGPDDSYVSHPVQQELTDDGVERSLVCSRKGITARGQYIDDGLLVFEGSEAKVEEYESCPVSASEHRSRLLNDGALVEEDGHLVFTEDHLFDSPSAAASVVLAQSANGWKEWKDESGKTLKSIYRS